MHIIKWVTEGVVQQPAAWIKIVILYPHWPKPAGWFCWVYLMTTWLFLFTVLCLRASFSSNYFVLSLPRSLLAATSTGWRMEKEHQNESITRFQNSEVFYFVCLSATADTDEKWPLQSPSDYCALPSHPPQSQMIFVADNKPWLMLPFCPALSLPAGPTLL